MDIVEKNTKANGTKVIFRSGLRTIGGTIVEVIKGNDRLVFDFGTMFDGQNGEEVLPEVDGIYNGKCNLNTAILLSHLHLDHTKAMNLIPPSIPIYMSEESYRFLEDLYVMDFEGFKGQRREYTSVRNKQKFNFGNFEITFLEVDHDVLGASAILIQNKDINLFYSGDIRLHGYNSQYTYDMIAYIKKLDCKIDVAIFEGVTISFIEDDYEIIPTNEVNELDYEKNFYKNVEEKLNDESLILVNPYIMGLERLKSIFDYAKFKEKKVCLTPKFSYLANKYYKEYDFVILGSDKYNVGKDIINYENLNDNYIIFFDYLNKEEYKNLLENYKDSIALVQTGGEPLGEFDNRWKDLEEYAEEYGVNIYLLGASGHASPEHLIYIVEEINPSFLMPLHSFKPELVKSKKEEIKQVLPIKDKEYIFEYHELLLNDKDV